MKHVLMVGGRDHTVKKFKKLGIHFSIIQKPDLVTDEQVQSSKKLIVMDYKNTKEVVKIAKVLHELNPFDAIISFAEYGLLPAAIASRELGLPSNDIFPIESTRDKYKTRLLLQEAKLGTVKFKLCHTVSDVKDFFTEVNFNPIIIKPTASAGSRGISFISESNEIEKEFIKAECGLNVSAQMKLNNPIAGRLLIPPREAKLISFPENCDMPGVLRYQFRGKKGKDYKKMQMSNDEIANFLLISSSESEMCEKIALLSCWFEKNIIWG